jgi:hypothetical protein
MRRLFVALCLMMITAAPSIADDKTDVMATVQRFTDGFNKGDTTMAPAACTEDVSIIDEFPPHSWHGAGSCLRWMQDYGIDAAKNGITDGWVVLGRPKHVDITGSRAYVVVPSTYTYKVKGKPVKEASCMFTLVLQKREAGWLISDWCWPKN